jgi:hypothetical protein
MDGLSQYGVNAMNERDSGQVLPGVFRTIGIDWREMARGKTAAQLNAESLWRRQNNARAHEETMRQLKAQVEYAEQARTIPTTAAGRKR